MAVKRMKTGIMKIRKPVLPQKMTGGTNPAQKHAAGSRLLPPHGTGSHATWKTNIPEKY
jgi:hypothetical protein